MHSTPAGVSGFPVFRLLIIAGAIFVSVTSEFLPTGLIPTMARDLGVSESQVGYLVTAFALTVVITTAPLTVLTRNISRKWLMVGLLGIFALANVLAAAAQSYELLMATRVLGGLAHGLFWTVTGPYAARLVRGDQLAKAVSVTGAGGSLAFILGIPLATALGVAIGWRAAFMAIAVTILVFALLVVLFLPPVEHRVSLATGEIAVPLHRDRTLVAVLVTSGIVLLLMFGHNVFYTYIAPFAIRVSGFAEVEVGPILFAYGLAGAVGLFIAGALGDRYPRGVVVVLIAAVGTTVGLLGVLGTIPWVAVGLIVVWSIAVGGMPALLHARMLRVASPRMRDLASAAITTAFNIAIGGGALVGGLLLAGFGPGILPFVTAALTALALAFVLITDTLAARAEARLAAADPAI